MSKFEHDTRIAEMRGVHADYDKPWFQSVSALLDRSNLRGLRCLELCAGNGEFAERLRDRHAMQVTCADYAPAHLERCRSLGFDVLPIDLDADSTRVDETARPIQRQFDIVTSLATIEHVFDTDNLLRFAHHVLRPGGVLIVNTPNISFLGYRLYSFFNHNVPFGEGHHVRFWDFRSLRTSLYLNGFDVACDGRDFYGAPEEPLARAFRGHRRIAHAVARLFVACIVLKRFPGGKGLFTDELTLLARKAETFPIGLGYVRVSTLLRDLPPGVERQAAIARLQTARHRGWLGGYLRITEFTDAAK